MTCPACDQKPMNCDCPGSLVEAHESIEELEQHIQKLRDAIWAVYGRADLPSDGLMSSEENELIAFAAGVWRDENLMRSGRRAAPQ